MRGLGFGLKSESHRNNQGLISNKYQIISNYENNKILFPF